MTFRMFRTVLAAACCLLAAPAPAQVQGTGDNAPSQVTYAYDYVSDQGGFKVRWPSGCGELTRRESTGDPDVDPFDQVTIFYVFCDQNGMPGAGCSVSSLFNLRNAEGGMPGPPEVVERLEAHLKALGVGIAKQAPVGKDLPDGTKVEGLDILARDAQGVGEAWLRGLIYEGDVFILTAWNRQGGLWDDPEFQDFFNKFEPLTE